jgi:diaminohydroxyphosphoribosylaminopyrimidine deaminase/5-amino-6-(5-phosphoribosylamino)uracil reductase
MNFDEQMMQRCIQLAKLGLGLTYPNPLVGCVVVHDGKIISEGWHQKAGCPHAEVNAIQSIKNKEILKESTLYVSLEPCAHFGKTPPCADLIIQHGIPKVVIGVQDPFSKVNGEGIRKLKDAEIEVVVGVLEEECLELNKRFFTFHQKKRPYIILKWAETSDGLMGTLDGTQKWISNSYSKQLVHKWRTEEQGILVGTRTALMDNPQLNARLWSENHPTRIILDAQLGLNFSLHIMDQSQKTLILTEKEGVNRENLDYLKIDFQQNLVENILKALYEHPIQSLIVEGGKKTLELFLEAGLWDEARIFYSPTQWEEGVQAPQIQGKLQEEMKIGSDVLKRMIP